MSQDHTEDRWNALYKDVDPYGVGRWISERERIINSFAAIPQHCHYANALDLGCGEGHFTLMLSEIVERVVAVEISPSAIERATKRLQHKNVEFIQEDMYHVEFADDSFDLICALESLDYTPNRSFEIEKWERWLKPGGIVVCTGPILPHYFRWGELADHFNSRFELLSLHPLTSKFILAKLANHGLVPFADKVYDLSMSLTRAMPSLLTKHLGVVAKSRKPLHAI